MINFSFEIVPRSPAAFEEQYNFVKTLGSAIDLLRALTHDKYANAYFIDPMTGSKVYVKILLERDKQK